MHPTYLYIEDNFVPNIVEDQFRRKKIGIGITLKEGETIADATLQAEQFIKEHIQKNTVVTHTHIQEKYIPESQLPEIQVEKEHYSEQTLEEQIATCSDTKTLEAYKFLVKKDPKLQLEYDKRMYILKELSPKK
jgi:hypothetical protein